MRRAPRVERGVFVSRMLAVVRDAAASRVAFTPDMKRETHLCPVRVVGKGVARGESGRNHVLDAIGLLPLFNFRGGHWQMEDSFLTQMHLRQPLIAVRCKRFRLTDELMN